MGVARRKQKRRLEVFEETYAMWPERCLTQAQVAKMLEVCERTFRRCALPHVKCSPGLMRCLM